MEYAAEQCQARVNSLVEALTDQGRTILTEVIMMVLMVVMMELMVTAWLRCSPSMAAPSSLRWRRW